MLPSLFLRAMMQNILCYYNTIVQELKGSVYFFQVDQMNYKQLEGMKKYLEKEGLHGRVCGGASSTF